MSALREAPFRFIVFCDDLSLTPGRLLQVAEGGARGRRRGPPANVLFYATSNRRHMMPRE